MASNAEANRPTPVDLAEIREVYETLAPLVLRDYFAGQAMCGLLARCALREDVQTRHDAGRLGRAAFAMADAMLAARNAAMESGATKGKTGGVA